jgi:UPF0755 protein
MKKGLILLLVMVFLLTGCGMVEEFKAPVDPEDTSEIVVNIPSGSSTTGIGEILVEYDLIYNTLIFKQTVKDLGYDGKLQAGDYKLSRSNDLETIIEKLYTGDVFEETLSFTIPEGLELDEIIDILMEERVIDSREQFMSTLKAEVGTYPIFADLELVNYEGLLFPDTYTIKKDASTSVVIRKMLNRMTSVFTEDMLNHIEENNLDLYKIINLASIIEREIVHDDERAIASSVFYNRLDINMHLQSCATVQYIIDERKPILSNQDIAIENDYNTYKYPGLPPGPIASPGEASIKAAVYPADTEYLYFVRSYENDDSHIFSTNLADHNRAARKLHEGE